MTSSRKTTDDIIDIGTALPRPAIITYQEITLTGRVERTALASEIALAISYNGINQAVMMISPGNIRDFVIGFSISNNIVARLDEIYDIQLSGSAEARYAEVEISNRAFWNLKHHRRQLTGASGCGICGVEALEQALPALTSLEAAELPDTSLFHNMRERIASAQKAAQSSGALHAALYLNQQGDIRFCREDIGRHNALDKLIGAITQANENPHKGLVVVTSRCSLELIHKAVRANIGTLVSLSAPTALTVQWARRYCLNLVHLPHQSPPRLYSPAPTGG